jgi:hypothetical protein
MAGNSEQRVSEGPHTGAKKTVAIGAVVGFLIVATVVARRRGYNIGLKTIVRCRQGHLLTTIP